MTSKISELYPYSVCNQCGWIGPTTALIEGIDTYSHNECCPECGLPDTEWLTTPEFKALQDGGEHFESGKKYD